MDKKVSRMGRTDGDITKVWSHKHDYPIEEIWNTDNTLARLIVPRLQAFKQLDKHGYPPDFNDMRAWNNTIQKMIDAFELIKHPDALCDSEKKNCR